MRPIHRSLAGLAIVILTLPVFMSLLACLPVPLGDPEKSRIDPAISGIWLTLGEGVAVTLFEPYDKRTWLVSFLEIDFDEECGAAADAAGAADADDAGPLDTYAAVIAWMARHDDTCYGADEVQLFKAWRARFGGKWFMSWEPKGGYEDDRGFAPEIWWAWRIDRAGPDAFSLQMLDAEYEGFEELEAYQAIMDADPPYDPRMLEKARKEIQRVIRRNPTDPELLLDEEDPMRFERVRPEHLDLFDGIVEDVIHYDEI